MDSPLNTEMLVVSAIAAEKVLKKMRYSIQWR
jgi:hypothetical protein